MVGDFHFIITNEMRYHKYFFSDNISILPFSHHISPLFFVVRIWTGEDPLISIGILYDSTHTTVIGLGMR